MGLRPEGPPAFLTRNRWAKCSVQIVLSNFGCGFLPHASAIFSPDALHRTQKSPRLIQKSTIQNSTNYLWRTLSAFTKAKCSTSPAVCARSGHLEPTPVCMVATGWVREACVCGGQILASAASGYGSKKAPASREHDLWLTAAGIPSQTGPKSMSRIPSIGFKRPIPFGSGRFRRRSQRLRRRRPTQSKTEFFRFRSIRKT